MGSLYSKLVHAECDFIRTKHDLHDAPNNVAELIYPIFECVVCNKTMFVCRLCGLRRYLPHRRHRYTSADANTYVNVNSINDFLEHLYVQHGDARYIKQCGGIYYYVGDIFHSIKHRESCEFLRQSPHVLFINTEGFDYLNRANDILSRCGNKRNPKIGFDNSLLIRSITEGSNSCACCGMEYETFPTYEVAAAHINVCAAPN